MAAHRASASSRELGAHCADPDALGHSLEKSDGVTAQRAGDLLESRGHRRAEEARAERGEEFPAHDKRGDLAQGELERELRLESVLDPPEAAPAVWRPVVVDREAGVLQHPEVPPDCPHRAAKGPRRVLDGHSLGPVEELRQSPLPGWLAAPGHDGAIFLSGAEDCQ